MRGTASSLGSILGLLALLIGLGMPLSGTRTPSALDSWFFERFAEPAGAVPIVRSVLLTCSTPLLVYGAAMLLAGWCLRKRRYHFAVLALAAPVIAVLCSSVLLKPLFGRYYDDFLCYPSGHTTLLVAVLTALVLYERRWLLAAIPLGLLGAFGLIAGRYHYLTDTFGGAALGCAVTLTVWLLIQRPWTARPAGKSRADTFSGSPRQASPR